MKYINIKTIKHIFKIIFINVVFIILIFFIMDYAFCNVFQDQKFYKFPNNYNLKMQSFDSFYNDHVNNKRFRSSLNVNSKKKSIIIFGCSFAYGFKLDENQTLSYKIAELTKKPVYNRAISSLGIQSMFYQLKRNDFYTEVKNPSHIVFVMIDHHVYRLFRVFLGYNENIFDVRYDAVNNKLKRKKPQFKFLTSFYIIKKIQVFIAEYLSEHNYDKNFDLMKLHFEESKKIAEKKFPGVKIVILKYNDTKNARYLNTPRWKELEEEGFIILSTKNLVKEDLSLSQYKLKDNIHPNAKAWDLIAPALVKELNL